MDDFYQRVNLADESPILQANTAILYGRRLNSHLSSLDFSDTKSKSPEYCVVQMSLCVLKVLRIHFTEALSWKGVLNQ